MPQLISVIIPAYNAMSTIGRTLQSVRAQTWREIEIIVVDDGSRDATAEHVRRQMQVDSRIRLVETENGGVARARNRAIMQARGEWIAPLDADDLWHPDKLAAQIAEAERRKEPVGLVYCWHAVIDSEDKIMGYGERVYDAGSVLPRMCLGNLIGNGSAALMRRSAVIEAGGYDASLRDRNAQGCEDLKLYFSIAEKHEFAVVPRHLVGYRWTPENMSSDTLKMLRSYDLVMNAAQDRHAEHNALFEQGRVYMLEWLLEQSIRSGKLTIAGKLWSALFQMRKLAALAHFYPMAKTLLRERLLKSRPRAGEAFFCGDPAAEDREVLLARA